MKRSGFNKKNTTKALFNGYEDFEMRPFDRSLPMSLLLAREAVMKGFREVIQRRDLSEQQWRIIRALVDADKMETGVLADRVKLLRPSLTRILLTLEQRGIVKKHRRDTDRRFSYISLTAKGKMLFSEIAPYSEQEYQRIEKKIGKKKLNQLYELLDLLTTSLS